MSSEVPPSDVEATIRGAVAHGVSHGYVLAFPCSYVKITSETPLNTTGVSAIRVCARFTGIGFHAVTHMDLDAASIVRRVAEAAQALRSFDVLVLYFCGHGFARAQGAKQYLVAGDGKHIDVETIHGVVSQAVNDTQATNVTLLTLLDCCRSEDEQRTWSPSW